MNTLTNREREIASYLPSGARNKVIASALGLAEVTVKMHLKNIFTKLGVSNRTQAAVKVLALEFQACNQPINTLNVQTEVRL